MRPGARRQPIGEASAIPGAVAVGVALRVPLLEPVVPAFPVPGVEAFPVDAAREPRAQIVAAEAVMRMVITARHRLNPLPG
jgi:hypothetical protein